MAKVRSSLESLRVLRILSASFDDKPLVKVLDKIIQQREQELKNEEELKQSALDAVAEMPLLKTGT